MNKTIRSIILSCMVIIFCGAMIFAEGTYYPGTNKGTPRRIVSLGPSATEILYAVGAGPQVVGRTDYCNYPEEASSVASIGGFDGNTFSIESVIAKQPDFVYLFAGMHDHLVEPLKKYGISVYVSNATSIDDVKAEILDIGRITGNESAAQAAVDRITAAVEAAAKNRSGKSVYWEVWYAPYMSVGNASFINGIIEAAGGKNIFGDMSEGYPVVSEETLLSRNPSVILIPSDNWTSVEDVTSRPNWSSVDAVKNGRVFIVSGDICSRPGPRVADAIELISGLLSK